MTEKRSPKDSLLGLLGRTWWILLVRGLLAIGFGVVAYTSPGITLATLVLLFGSFALVSGVFEVIGALKERSSREHWWLLLLEGLLGIAVGVLTLRAPEITGLALVLYIAAWALVTGVLQIVAAIRLREEIEGELWLGLSGLLSVATGVVLMVSPGAGAIGLLWVIAGFAIAWGVVLILLGLRVRQAVRALA